MFRRNLLPCALFAILAASCTLSYVAGRRSSPKTEEKYPVLLIACDPEQSREQDWTLDSTPRGHRASFVYKSASARDKAYSAALDALMGR